MIVPNAVCYLYASAKAVGFSFTLSLSVTVVELFDPVLIC